MELGVHVVIVEWDDWDAVELIEDIAVGGVVDQDEVLSLEVGKYSQVLDVHSSGSHDAMIPEQSSRDVLSLGVQLVEHGVGIGLVAGCEDYQLEVGGKFFQDFSGMGSDVDVGLR